MPIRHIISLGAGVQSSTLALMAAVGEITPMPDCAVFADTQDEPASVYRWLDWLETQLPFPVQRVTAGSLSRASLSTCRNRKTGKSYYSNLIPAFVRGADGSREGKVSRHCTRDFKVYPILRHVRRLAQGEIAAWRRERRAAKAAPAPVVVQWIGISLDEAHRMKPPRDPWVGHRWPLIELEMRRHDCLRWMAARGYPTPPRSACRYCPYKSDHEWRRLKEDEPEEFTRACEYEQQLQHLHASIVTPGKIKGIPFLHRSCVPLGEVDLSTDTARGQFALSLFGNDCEGMCGV